MNAVERMPARAMVGEHFDDGQELRLKLPWVFLAGLTLGAMLLIAFGSAAVGVSSPFWYLSRSSAVVGFVLLWASMALGVMITNKMARVWPGGPTAFELHHYFSWLGLGFTTVHVLTLLGDEFIDNTVLNWLLPFASTGYEQVWVGLGQVAFYMMIPVLLSFYARKRLGTRAWRTVHGLSHAVFFMGLFHGLFSGTDSGSAWAMGMYVFTGASLVGLTVYRVVTSVGKKRAAVV